MNISRFVMTSNNQALPWTIMAWIIMEIRGRGPLRGLEKFAVREEVLIYINLCQILPLGLAYLITLPTTRMSGGDVRSSESPRLGRLTQECS